MPKNTIKITSWNINSVRLRMPLVKKVASEIAPDILCLQETKVEDGKFPSEDIKKIGFEHIAFSGQKSYNGVAILSKIPLNNIEARDILGNSEARHISASLPSGVRIENFYIPAGGDIPDINENPKFADKIEFVDRLKKWSESLNRQDKYVILGDFNIAPYEHDVWSHKQLLKVVSHTPIEVENLGAFLDSGEWIDVARKFVPMDEKLYSWWSYRNRDWKKSNRGRRLDHIWTSPNLKDNLHRFEVLPEARDWEKPSDHVPITLTMAE